MHILDTSSKVTLEERRAADGLDAYVPRILCDGELYDADVDRFFLDLPLKGVRSRHSLRAYGYDIMVWLRFLTEFCARSEDGREGKGWVSTGRSRWSRYHNK